MEVSGSHLIGEAFKKERVDVLFGFPGAAIMSLFDELYKDGGIRVVLHRHEQGAVHSADGYARSTGKIGVCLVTSGPGATNTVTGLATANFDSVPIVCISGQVPTNMIGNDTFQEADIVGISRSVTKHNYPVADRKHLGRIIKEAFYIARSGRPGPVVVDIPKDVLLPAGSRAGYLSRRGEHPWLQPGVQGPLRADQEGGFHPSQGQKATVLRRRRCADRRRQRVIQGDRGHHRRSGDLFAHGDRDGSQRPPPLPRHDRDARDVCGEHGRGGVRPDLCRGNALRRPGHGQAREVRPHAKIVHMDIDPAAIVRNVPVAILNNGYLGMVRQWQELFFDRRYASTCLMQGTDCPPDCDHRGEKCPVWCRRERP